MGKISLDEDYEKTRKKLRLFGGQLMAVTIYWKLSILQQVNWKVFLTFHYGIKRNLIKIFNLEILFVSGRFFPFYYPIVLRMWWRCNSFSYFSWCALVYLGSSCLEMVLMAADDKLEFYLRIFQKETCWGFSQAIRHSASLSFPGTPSRETLTLQTPLYVHHMETPLD